MTSNKKQKKQIRARMDRTGESYSTARQAVLAQSQAPTLNAEARPRSTEEQDEDSWYRQTIADLNTIAAKHANGQRAEWVDLDTIVKILNDIGTNAPNNHMFFPVSGGLDLRGAVLSHETGCIELRTDGHPSIVRPRSLQLEKFKNDADGEWTYFRLNLAPLSPVNGDPSRHREELTELAPGTYEERSLLDGHDVTASARGVSRWFKGAFVIFAKGSTYNLSPSTYDGRHSLGRKYKETTADAFRTYIEKVIEGLAASRTASPNARAPSP